MSLWHVTSDSKPSRLGTLVLPAAIALSVVLSGCGTDPSQNVASSQMTNVAAEPIDELTLAMGTISSLATAKDSESFTGALFHLNQWASGQKEVDFEVDPLVAIRPRAYEKVEPLADLRRPRYDLSDLGYLQQSLWFRDIAQRVGVRAAPPDLAPWLKEQEKTIGISQVQNLASAERLFDWTICNVQLDKLPPPPKPPVAGTRPDDPASQPGPLRGEPGPGYGQLPGQSLLLGHGDAWQRARVFMLLARQLGIDVVMLGLPDASGSGAIRPWVCGAFIKGHLYLFDPELGLPIPGPGGQGIATLEQAANDPHVLRALDIPGGTSYPVADTDLKGITAMIDAEPQALTLRMKVLESALAGKPLHRVKLSCDPSLLEKELRQCKQVSAVNIWRVSLEAVLYQNAIAEIRQTNAEARRSFERMMFPFQPPHPLAEARHLQFIGKFGPQGEEQLPGACQVFASLRLPNTAIEAITSSGEIRGLFGVREANLSPNPLQRKAQLEAIAADAKRIKDHATYFLGLAHLDAGNHSGAQEWFQKRTLEESPASPWVAGARYNLGRCYEALGEWKKAHDIYLEDDSPQQHGNHLRAQWIARRHLGE